MKRKNVDSYDLSNFLPKKQIPKKIDSADLSSFLPKSKDTKGLPPINHTKSASIVVEKTNQVDKKEKEHPEKNLQKQIKEEEEEEIYTDEEQEITEELPISHHVFLKEHERAVTALDLDPSGSRLISGSYDYKVHFWDFNGMDQSLKSFRSIQPWDGYQIKDVKYNLKGDMFLVVSGASHPKLYDRDGYELMSYVGGDPYIRDMRHTKGHVAPLTCCAWHPNLPQLFMTAGNDSTIRIWDVDARFSCQTTIVSRAATGGRTASAVSSACFTPDGKYIAGAKQDGSVTIWDPTTSIIRPIQNLDTAHMAGSETSRISFASDNFTFVTRGGDDTLKLWDLRRFDKPVKAVHNLPNFFAETDCIFSPNEKYIITGISVKKGADEGKLFFFDRYNLSLKQEMNVSKSSVVRILWHPKINQILLGNSDASISALYDPNISVKGITLSMAKTAKKRAEAVVNQQAIFNPNALPMFAEEDMDYQRRKGKDRVLRRPAIPIEFEWGHGVRKRDSDIQTILKDVVKSTVRDEDPREALLKYAEDAEENPVWVGHAYKKNQPKTLFDDRKDTEEEEIVVPRRQ